MTKVNSKRPAAQPSNLATEFQSFEKKLVGEIDKELKSILTKFESGFESLLGGKSATKSSGNTATGGGKAAKAKGGGKASGSKKPQKAKAKGHKPAAKAHKKPKSSSASKTSKVKQTVGGQVGKWIAQAQAVLKANGVPLSRMNAKDIALIIQHESGGNPKAINRWDSNAKAGHPSQGLMQTIPSTFNAYKVKGHNQILNPVDNIIAGVRYAISRYGSISNVPGVRNVHRGGAYVGY